MVDRGQVEGLGASLGETSWVKQGHMLEIATSGRKARGNGETVHVKRCGVGRAENRRGKESERVRV